MEIIIRKQVIKIVVGYLCIGFYNLKGFENVGFIMCVVGCYGVNMVFYIGKCYECVIEFCIDIKQVYLELLLIGVDDLQQVIFFGCVLIVIEVYLDVKLFIEYWYLEWVFYIFGLEDGGLKKNVILWCKDIIYIFIYGCMNLVVMVNVVFYD